MMTSPLPTMGAELALGQGRTAQTINSINDARTPARMREVAEEFEAMFLSQMLQPMFNQISTEAPFGGGNAERIWRSQMVDHYAKSMVKAGGIGLADSVEREMLKLQEIT